MRRRAKRQGRRAPNLRTGLCKRSSTSAVVSSAASSVSACSSNELALLHRSGKHPAVRSQSIKRQTLALVILLHASVGTAPASAQLPLRNPLAIPDAQWLSLFAGTAPDGRNLSAEQLGPLVLHAHWPMNSIPTRVHWHLKVGVFLLKVRGDGTVSGVEMLQSIGHPTANADCIRAFAQWRFRPNSVREARVPAYYTREK